MTTPHAHGGDRADDAALLLIESLIHELIAAGALDLERAAAVVEIAVDTRAQIRSDALTAAIVRDDALSAILATLSHDRTTRD